MAAGTVPALAIQAAQLHHLALHKQIAYLSVSSLMDSEQSICLQTHLTFR